MLSEQQRAWIISKALIPEQLPELMSYLSGGEPELFEEEYLLLRSNKWVIFVGYPISGNLAIDKLAYCIEKSFKKYKPKTLWLLSEGISSNTAEGYNPFVKGEEDYFYKIAIPAKIEGSLKRAVKKASELLQVEIEQHPTPQHRELIAEFITNRTLPDHIKELYLKLPEYVKNAKDAFLLSAYTRQDKVLTAFFVVEMGAKRFSAYMIGCSSKTNYVPYSSDLLMYELLRLSEQRDKEFVSLGIGVNEGIRRFKEKWGGTPYLKYNTYEYKGDLKKPAIEKRIYPRHLSLLQRAWDFLRGHRRIKTIWQVNKGIHISYLIGSTHMFSHSFVPFLRDIIERVDEVVVEGPLDKERMQQVVNSGIHKSRLSLQEYIDNRTIELLADTYLRAYFKGMADMIKENTYFLLKQSYISDIRDMIKRYSHWMSYFSLWYMFLDHHHWKHSMDMDAVMLAKGIGKRVHHLESIEEQIEAMEGIPIDRIMRFLKKADLWEGHIMRFQKVYLKGDMNKIFTHTSEFPARCESIIERRDPIMFERMRPYLDKGNALILVGISHIPGITDRLIHSGYRVRSFYETGK